MLCRQAQILALGQLLLDNTLPQQQLPSTRLATLTRRNHQKGLLRWQFHHVVCHRVLDEARNPHGEGHVSNAHLATLCTQVTRKQAGLLVTQRGHND